MNKRAFNQRLIRKIDGEIRATEMLTPQTDQARKTIMEYLDEKRAQLKALREEEMKARGHKVV
jgi:hypothetical protein